MKLVNGACMLVMVNPVILIWDIRHQTLDWRPEIGDWRLETGNWGLTPRTNKPKRHLAKGAVFIWFIFII